MIVNGFPNGSPQPIVWQETVNVLPNTTYYFSAWAMSLNSAGPFASLRFDVNGTQTGLTATLGSGVNNNSNNGWVRFYGTWTSGPTTTSAVISIVDLQTAPGGNDFGLDDISFATLSTFINLESAPGTDAQTICKNAPLTKIVYTVGNGNPGGPSVSGLPLGVTSSFSGNFLTISGTPTVAGTYTYTLTTTGCNPISATGTITVQEDSIKLTAGSAAPVCKGLPMPNLVYTVGGTATGASATGLPAGVTGTYDGTAHTFTIGGTPTAPTGTYNYTVTTSGTVCPGTAASINGTITIQAETISLTSAPATANQTVCINTAITNINYTVGGTGTGATVTGLPAGVTGTFNSGIYQIKGTPTQAGTFNYQVLTSGTCKPDTATGTIIVTPAAVIALTSAPGTDGQTVCTGVAITPIVYTITNATGASIISGALPAGITGTYDATAHTFTISGTSTETVGKVFNYTVGTSGGCASASKSGSITINAQTVQLTSGSASQSVCQGAPINPIVFTISGLATGATVSGLPTGMSGSITAGNTFTISGSTSDPSGPYTYTVTTTGGSCGTATATGIITVSAAAVPGTITPPATVCGGSSGTLTLLGNSSNPIRWESSTTGGAPWTAIANTTVTLAYTNATSAIWYRAVVSNGCGPVPSNAVLIGIHNLWTGTTSADWNTASNWSDNQLPSASCPNVHIPGGTPHQPLINSGTVLVQNLQIDANATLTVAAATLQVSGGLTNQGGLDVTTGTLEFNGSAPQTVTSGSNVPVKNLLISNTNASGVTLSGTGSVDVYSSVDFSAGGKTLAAGDGNLTIKSTAAQTAMVGDLTGHDITGNVTVERYINTLGHGKSWEFLAIPTKGPDGETKLDGKWDFNFYRLWNSSYRSDRGSWRFRCDNFADTIYEIL